MAWIAVGTTAVSVGGSALASGLAAKSANKNRPGVPAYQPYNGPTPPGVDYEGHQILRPVQQMVSDTLMRRSQGQDVGYDPALMQKSMQTFDIGQTQAKERGTADINNQLSGTGQSKNLAARDYLLGRYNTDQERERNKYSNQLDVASLERANQERDTNTARLQDFNNSNFGQENNKANFGLETYKAQNVAQNQNYANQVTNYQQYQDPNLSGIQGGTGVAGTIQGFQNNQSQNALNNSQADYLKKLAQQMGTSPGNDKSKALVS